MEIIWQYTILSKSLFLHSDLILIDNGLRFTTSVQRTCLLEWPLFGLPVMARDTWNHRVLVIIVLFPSYQVILVQLFLNISHIAVCLQCLSLIDLTVETIFVVLDRCVLFISLSLIKLIVEKANLLGVVGVILTSGLRHGVLPSFVCTHLLEQLLLVLLTDARLVILSHLCTLVHDLLIVLYGIISVLLFT